MNRLHLPIWWGLAHALLAGACGSASPPTRAEVLAEALARFDSNGNGTIESNEYPPFHPVDQGFKDLDSNGDSAITVDELGAFLQDTQPREQRSDRQIGDAPEERE